LKESWKVNAEMFMFGQCAAKLPARSLQVRSQHVPRSSPRTCFSKAAGRSSRDLNHECRCSFIQMTKALTESSPFAR
jgi:hypothetical protein